LEEQMNPVTKKRKLEPKKEENPLDILTNLTSEKPRRRPGRLNTVEHKKQDGEFKLNELTLKALQKYKKK